uniref:Uncharacterized protein n=1 Tax=Periophthalmus magnuspinnatus TaxID=409849 RepID=A0A3B3Z881_9GOBI
MLTLASKLKRDEGTKHSSESSHRVSVRDRLLTKGTTANTTSTTA